MDASWYCNDCEKRIDREEIEDHETDGHEVRGILRPDRLLGNDPGNMGIQHGEGSTGNGEVTD